VKSFIYIILAGLFPVLILGHGVEYSVFNDGIGVEARYKEGNPISHADVNIYRPGNRESVFQRGITDNNGRFVFAPDTAGEWIIEIDDGMGHGLIENITVSKSLDLNEKPRQGLSRLQQILVGISIIFGITGIGFYAAARK